MEDNRCQCDQQESSRPSLGFLSRYQEKGLVLGSQMRAHIHSRVRKAGVPFLSVVVCSLHTVATAYSGTTCPAFVNVFSPATRSASFQQNCATAISARAPRVLLAKGAGLLDRAPRAASGLLATVCKVQTRVAEDFEGGLGTKSLPLRSKNVLPPAIDDDPLVIAMLDEAKIAEKAGDSVAAQELYDAILRKQPENGKVWMKKFLLCRQAQNYSAGREVLRTALKKLPGNAILWQAWADMEWTLGKHCVARNLYKKGLEANPYLPSLYNAWGGMERALGNSKAARKLFTAGLEKNPESARLHLSMAILEDVEGNTKRAEGLLRAGINIEPGNPHLLHALALLEYKRGEYGEARSCFKKATESSDGFTLAWLSWGRMEEELGHTGIAREKYILGCKTKNNKGAVQLWQAWARLEERSGNARAALDVYTRAVALYPRDAGLLVEWAKLQEKRGEVYAAINLYKRALAASPKMTYAYQCLATLEAKQGRKDSARAVFEAGLDMAAKLRKEGGSAKPKSAAAASVEAEGDDDAQTGKKDEANLLHAWAALEAHEGNIERTRELLNQALELDNSQGWLWLAFARFETEHGDEWLAQHYFARAVNAAPREPETWRHWSEFEKKRGNVDRARTYAQRCAELNFSKDLAKSRPDPKKPLIRRWGK